MYDDRFSDVSGGTYFNPPSPGMDYLRQSPHLMNRRASPMFRDMYEMGSNPMSPNLKPHDVFGPTYAKSRPPSRVEDVVGQVDWKQENKGWNPWSSNIFPDEVVGSASSKSVTPGLDS